MISKFNLNIRTAEAKKSRRNFSSADINTIEIIKKVLPFSKKMLLSLHKF